MLKFKFFNILTVAVMLLQALMPIQALAMATTNLPDYAPGSVVTIYGDNSDGAGYLPAETVHVDVTGPDSFTAACDAVADDSAAWSCQVTLPSDAAEGNYDYTAAGLTSGVSESGFFTVTAPPAPTVEPTQAPTQEPTVEPTQAPTEEPTSQPTVEPTASPTVEPTSTPTEEPRLDPTDTPAPTPTGPVLTPFITSDKADYAPGELVTLTSGNWQPGESVHLVVNDTLGDSWRLSEDASADSNGEFTYQFNLPNWFVAQYHVYAYGGWSGSATADFTDAASLALNPTSGPTGTSVSATSGGGGFDGNSNNIGIYWDGTTGTASGTLLATCSTNNGGNITGTCTFTVPASGAGTLHTVVATQGNKLSNSASAPFSVTGPATKLAFTTAALTLTAGATSAGNITVQLQDSSGIPVNAGAGGQVVNLSTSSSGGIFRDAGNTLTITTVTIASGANIASFKYNDTVAGTPTITASASGLTSATQVETVNPAAANKLAFGQQPTNTTAGQTITPAVKVQIQDAFGNLTSSTAAVTVAIGTNPSLGTLSGTKTVNAVAGVATFSTLSINNAGNGYTLTATSGTLTSATSNAFNITAACTAPSITTQPTNQSATYGDASVNFTATASGSPTPTVQWQVKIGAGSFTNLTNAAPYSGVTTGTLTITSPTASLSANQYRAVFTNTCGGTQTATSNAATLTVNPKSVTPNITANDKVYDGTTTATLGSQTLTGVLAGDAANVTLNVGASNFDTKSVGSGKTVTATGLTLSGSAAGNYQLSSTTATTTANITARALIVSATGVNKVYDGTTSATVTLSDNRVAGDILSTSYTSASFANKNVGTGKTISVTGISVSGSDAGNYTFNTTASATADITARPLTVSATGINKVYDGNTSATVTLSDNRISGDVFTDSYTSAVFANKNVGTGKTVSVTGISISGTDAGNYTFNTTASTTADITALDLTVTATGLNKVYDGNTSATVTLSDNRVSGDVFTDSYTSASFANKNVGTGKTVSVSGISISGTDAGNYNLLNTTAITTANIASLGVSASITANDKVYDGTNAATFNCALSGVVSGDDVSCTGGTATFDDKNVGTGKTVTATGLSLSGADAGNYALSNTSASDTADVTPLAITGSITASDKVYDGTDTATILTRSLSGVISGDDVTYVGGTATFANKNVGTGKTVTATGLSLDGDDAGNYTVNGTAITTADITARPLTISATGVDKVYDGTAAATVTLSDNRVSGDDVTVSYTNAAFDDKNVGTGKTVSVSGISISGTDAGNYTFNTSASTTADITPRDLTITATADNKVYDGTTTAVAHLSDNRVSGDVLTASYTSADFSNKNVGTGKTVSVTGISISGTDAGNYNLLNATASATADITKRDLTVSATGVSKIYDGTMAATVNLSDNKISGDDVTDAYTSASFADKNVGTGKTVSVSGISISGTDAGNYNLLNTTATTTANIASLGVTASIIASNKVYNGTDAATFSCTLSGFISGDDVSCTGGTATFDTKNVGTGKTVTATGYGLSGADAGNYAISNASATDTADITALAITGSITAADKVYNGTTAATILTRSLTGVISGDDVSYVGGTAAFANKNVGTGKTVTATGLSLDGDDAGNYTVNSTATDTADITPKALTTSITADDKVYDGNDSASFACELSGVIGLDDVICTGGTATFTNKNVGTDKIVTATGLSLDGDDAGNYTVNGTATTTADITARALTISATGINKVYDSTTSATVTLSDDRVSGDVFTATYTSASFANKNVGTGKSVSVSGVSISGTDAGNYTFNTTASTTADITPLAITGGITAADKVYDGTDTATILTRTLSGMVSGDDVSYVGGTATFDDKNVGTGKTVTATGLSLDGDDAGNYTVNGTATTTADITALAITGSITAADKVYDGTDAATILTRTLSGMVSGDDVSYVGGTATFDDKNVGTDKTVTASGLSLSGDDADNYTVNSVATTTADITPLAITGSITAADKVYDGTDAATILTRTLSGMVSGDDVSYVGGTATFDDKNVGTGKTVTATGLSLDGDDAGNYTVNGTATTTADITARPLTISATGVDKVYDGTTSATVTLSDNRVSGDVFTDSYTSASFSDKNVDTGKTVSVSGISISGADAGNYTFNATASATADITERALTISATGINKVYDGTTVATVTLSDDRLSGDVFTDSYTSASFADKNVGTSKTVSVSGISISGTDAGNYTFNSTASTTANITQRDLTVNAQGVDKVYDGTIVASVTLSDDKVSGDDVIDAYTSASFDDKNVGTGKDVSVSGISISGDDAGNYNLLNTTAGTTANITARTLTIMAHGVDTVYDGTTNATVTLTDNRVAGDTLSTSYTTANFADKNVGTSKTVSVSGISISGADAGNYTFNTTASTTADTTERALTISATGINKVYDGTTSATVTLSDDRVSGDVFIDSYTSASFSDKNVGTSKTVSVSGISISGADAGNYTFNTTASTTADITARNLTVTATGVNKVYDGTTSATVTLSDNRVSGDVFIDSYTSAAFADKNVDTDKAVSVSGISISGADAGNYNLLNITDTTTADITARALTVTAHGIDKIYNGTTAATVTLTDNRISGDVFTDSYTSASFTNKNVGTGKTVNVSGISISGTDAGNYTFNTTASTTADITARDLTVTTTADNKVYDGTTVAVAHLSDNRVSGDVFTDSYTSASFANKNVGTGKTVSVSGISISGTDAGNYNLLNTTASMTADITPRPITVTADAKTKVYGSVDPALTYQVTSGTVISGDSFSSALSRVTGENVGTYAINQNTLALSSNYTLTYVGANLSLTEATLTVTADNKSKLFGDPDPAFTFIYAGFKFSDTAGVIDTIPTCGVSGTHTAVGTYTISCSSGVDNNYTFNYVNGTLTIGSWTLKGFYQPVDMNGIWNTVKNGSTVPLKFEIFAGLTELTDVSAVKSISAVQISCTGTGTEDAIEITATGSTVLRYDSTGGQFIYNWKTPSTANKCYRVTMTALDGSKLEALFKLK